MTKILCISLITIIINSAGYCQNLLPDGSFENIDNAVCINPGQGFDQVVDWYGIQGSPDLFNSNCNVQQLDEIFWSANGTASEGSNFIGLRCRVNSNQSYLSEGLATSLATTIKENEAYLLTLKVRNKGFYQGFPSSVVSCPLKPQKQVEIYLHDNKIVVSNDFSNGSATCNGNLVTSIQSPTLQSDKVSKEWNLIGTCFRPLKDATSMAIIMPLGNFGMFPECAADDTQGTFFSYYFEIDDIILITLPESIEIDKFFRKGSEIEIYLPEELDLPPLENARYLWADGYEGIRRSLSEEGLYNISLDLDCGSIPLLLNLQLVEQEFPFFIPNVFSPNEDGINDKFEVFIPVEEEVKTFYLAVYDRWGNKIFDTNDHETSWDGFTSQKSVNSGQYIYHLSCTLSGKSGDQDYIKSGSIMISR